MPLISFNQVTFQYGKSVTALESVSFDIDNGEFVFLVGPSGSGKTTFLRLMIRELTPTSGTIIFDGEEISKRRGVSIPKLRKKIGTSFQDVKLIKDRTIFENVAVMLEIIGKKKQEIKDAVDAALDLVGLADKADQFPVQLSGGEVQRIGIARAIVGDPVILFADEPTANLDEESSWKVMSLLKEINRRGKTVIVATHNLEVVTSMGERVLQLEKGKLIRDYR